MPLALHSLHEILNVELFLPFRSLEKPDVWRERMQRCAPRGGEIFRKWAFNLLLFPLDVWRMRGHAAGAATRSASRPITFRRRRGWGGQPSLCGARAKPPSEGEESSSRRTSSSMRSPPRVSEEKALVCV